MSTRKITFPDHTADDFDSDQVFEADNELKYTWNGYGWELVDGGIEGYDDTALWEDQQRQDDAFALDQKRQDDDFTLDQKRQDDAFTFDQQRQDDAFALDQNRQDDELAAEIQSRAERDLLHDAQIETIEYKLDALLGLTFRGTYEFKHEADCDAAYLDCSLNTNDPAQCSRDFLECEQNKVRPGYFEALDPDDQFDHLQAIVIAKSDKSGVEIEWDNVLKQGDYLEVDHVLAGGLDKTNYGLYRLTEDPEQNTNAHGESVYTLQLEFLQGDGEMLEGEKYEIRGITAAEGVNPEELGDFLTKDDAATLYAPKSHVHKGEDITSGKVSINRLPTGTSSSTVALGNHGHSGYSGTGHGHSGYVKGSFTITKSNGNYYIS